MEHNVAISSRKMHAAIGPEDYAEIRAGFVRQGTSLAAYCREKGIHRQNARACLLGLWKGPAADVLSRQLYEAAGIAR